MTQIGGTRRLFSSPATVAVASKGDVISPEADVILPKMPPFDYSPPRYSGPTSDEILKKRKEFLSPSMFTFFNQPVSFFILFYFILFIALILNFVLIFS